MYYGKEKGNNQINEPNDPNEFACDPPPRTQPPHELFALRRLPIKCPRSLMSGATGAQVLRATTAGSTHSISWRSCAKRRVMLRKVGRAEGIQRRELVITAARRFGQ